MLAWPITYENPKPRQRNPTYPKRLNMIFFSLLALGKNPPSPKIFLSYNVRALLFIGHKGSHNKQMRKSEKYLDPLFPTLNYYFLQINLT